MTVILWALIAAAAGPIILATATLTLLTTIALAVLPKEPASVTRCDLTEITERKWTHGADVSDR